VSEAIRFVVNGKAFTLTVNDVEKAMRGVEPEPVRSHVVVVKGQRYPVKQVFERATGLDRLDFTSATARRHLTKLGFKLSRTTT
jgi:hypothetical protein